MTRSLKGLAIGALAAALCLAGAARATLVQIDPAHNVVSTGPLGSTATGFQQVASFSTSTGFTPPAGSTVCYVTPEGNAVRFRTDGTAPTASVGAPIAVGQQLTLTVNLSAARFIPQTGSATLDVDCYK